VALRLHCLHGEDFLEGSDERNSGETALREKAVFLSLNMTVMKNYLQKIYLTKPTS
jgi:hypothetical protein